MDIVANKVEVEYWRIKENASDTLLEEEVEQRILGYGVLLEVYQPRSLKEKEVLVPIVIDNLRLFSSGTKLIPSTFPSTFNHASEPSDLFKDLLSISFTHIQEQFEQIESHLLNSLVINISHAILMKKVRTVGSKELYL